MPGKQYTVQHPDGRTVTFEWNGTAPPTDADMEEVFQSISSRPTQEQIGQQSQAANEAQRQNIMQASRQKAQEKFAPVLSPFSYIGQKVGGETGQRAGSLLDPFSPVPALAGLYGTVASIPKAPNVETGVSRAGKALTQLGGVGMQALYPAGAGIFGAGQKILEETPVAPVIKAITSPFQTFGPNNTEIERNRQQTLDIGLQALAAKLFQEPVKTGGQIAGPIARSEIPESLPIRIEKMASKPPFNPSKGIEVADRLAETNIRENLNTSRRGLDKSQNILNVLDQSSKGLRDAATKSGKSVDFESLKEALNNSKNNFANDADFSEKSAAIDDIVSRAEILAKRYPDSRVPLDVAWNFKKSLQNMVGKKYDEIGGYKAEAAKNTAHFLLDDMISQVPELRDTGLRQRDLIETQTNLARRVNQAESANIVSGRTVRALATGGLDTPTAKHYVAVALDRLRRAGQGEQNVYGDYKPNPLPPRGMMAAPPAPPAGSPAAPPPSPSTPTETPLPPGVLPANQQPELPTQGMGGKMTSQELSPEQKANLTNPVQKPEGMSDADFNVMVQKFNQPNPRAGEYQNTTAAVTAGSQATITEALRRANEYLKNINEFALRRSRIDKISDIATKRAESQKLSDETSRNQVDNREFAEGKVAQLKGTDHVSYGHNPQELLTELMRYKK